MDQSTGTHKPFQSPNLCVSSNQLHLVMQSAFICERIACFEELREVIAPGSVYKDMVGCTLVWKNFFFFLLTVAEPCPWSPLSSNTGESVSQGLMSNINAGPHKSSPGRVGKISKTRSKVLWKVFPEERKVLYLKVPVTVMATCLRCLNFCPFAAL